ncbi:MAG: type II toxin-antitoxin system VapC family toxin [Candidatus Bathyarchaeia archaeon]
MRRFVDTNIFIYAATGHPRFGETSRKILRRIEAEEEAITSTLVLCEVSWVLEAMGRQGDIKPTLEKILSYEQLEVHGFDEDDLLVGANNISLYHIDLNDGLNLAIMERLGTTEAYSTDERHIGQVDAINLIFE